MRELVVIILEWKTLMKKTVEVERPAQNSMEVCTFLIESKFELIHTVTSCIPSTYFSYRVLGRIMYKSTVNYEQKCKL